ncbi:aconitase family protein [Pusillimonas sp. ANT_WB101]|uniref:3-isopropylmalate dehydratase large subunit n=1 Tax=Pusillimonas sp. ANT_WB101 TaxID=2597356 RepID=UPI00165E62C3|nr:aconitase family protein [Pusillimonas sp. ANT_WB101]
MAMTSAEKILARASGKDKVSPGDIVQPNPELVIMHDGYVNMAYEQLSQLGYRRITAPEKVMIITDHKVLHLTSEAILDAKNHRHVAEKWGVRYFFGAGQAGHGHIYPMEVGLVKPGMFLFSYDMHCTNFGAVGAYAHRAGPDIITVLATGSLWVTVPATIRIELTGQFAFGAHPRDLGFWLSSQLSPERLDIDFDYRVVEFSGHAVDEMPLSSRVALCNTLTEIGVANVLFPSQQLTGGWQTQISDEDAHFENKITLDIGEVSPQVVLPGAPDQGVSIDEVVGLKIDHAFIGACGSGMYDDFRIAADILKNKKIAPHVRMFVVPGTVAVAKQLSDSGLSNIFADAGAIQLPPGCGLCAGGLGGPLAPNEVSISTAATNGAGRMGAKDAKCYLGSPITVARSAIEGCITDPRT